MIILGIETSCDETAASVIEGQGEKIKVLSNVVSSQIEIHKKYGGVVPEIAAREHVLSILPVIDECLKIAKIKLEKIDAIAVAIGPGLITSLITGIETAKTLAYAWDKPLVAVNHVEAHIYSNFIEPKNKIKFPALVLTVSGGHNMLVLMEGHGQFKTIGQTRDDAAGEAFDKAAKLMNLGYPGGPIISQQAALCVTRSTLREINLPRPMINSKNFEFSFSGLKTALLYQIQKDKNWKERIPEYCYEFQQAIIDVLISKTMKAAEKYQVKTIMLSGGVSANSELRKQFTNAVTAKFPESQIPIPKSQYCTDNAAMVATAGYFKAKLKKYVKWDKIRADCNAEL